MKNRPKDPQNILLIDIAGIGDLVMATPAFRAFRETFGAARILLLTTSRSAEIIEESPYIDEVVSIDFVFNDSINLLKSLLSKTNWLILRRLQRLNCDYVVNLKATASFPGALRMALLFRVINGKYTVGRGTGTRAFFYTTSIPECEKSRTHEVNRILALAEKAGCTIGSRSPEIHIPHHAAQYVTELFAAHNLTNQKVIIGLNPGGFRPSRRWVPKRWAQVADALITGYKATIIFTGSTAEREIITRITTRMSKTPITFCGDLTVMQLAALLQSLTLFITNDSGPMHIAAALHTPLIALFGPGDIHRIRPFNPDTSSSQVILRKEVSCERPCYTYDCDKPDCMTVITVDDVLTAADTLLSGGTPTQ